MGHEFLPVDAVIARSAATKQSPAACALSDGDCFASLAMTACFYRPERSHRAGALELGAVHQAAGRGVEGVAAVHRAAVVPPDEVADQPFLGPGEAILDHVGP